MTLTRIGVERAQLSGGLDLEQGARAALELNRPTDGHRIRVPITITSVRREGQQWGWKPAFHVQFDQPLERCVPLSLGVPILQEEASRPSPPTADAAPPPPPSPTPDPAPPRHAPAPLDPPPASEIDGRDAPPTPPWEVPAAAASPAPADEVAGPFCGPPVVADPDGAVPRRGNADTPWSSPSSAAEGRVGRPARILSEAPATYSAMGQQRLGTVQDFGRQGMFLATDHGESLPRAGAVIRVEFPLELGLDTVVVRFSAEVRWIHGEHDPHTPGRGMGLQLIDFESAAERRDYETYVDALLHENVSAPLE